MGLCLNPAGNIYAANGIAAAYAELGDLGTARTMFTQIQETVLAQGGFLTMPSVAINLANVELAEAQFAKAIQLYQSTLSKYDPFRTVFLPFPPPHFFIHHP